MHIQRTKITAAGVLFVRDGINIIFPVQLPEAGHFYTLAGYIFRVPLLCSSYNLAMKLYNRKIVVFDSVEYEKKGTSLSIDRTETESWSAKKGMTKAAPKNSNHQSGNIHN